MLFYGNAEHGAGRGAVNVAIPGKDIRTPCFSCQPRKHPGFNGRKVRYGKLQPLPGHKGRTDQLGKDIGDGIIQEIQGFVISLAYQFPGFREIRQMILGQILQLDVPAGKPPGPVGPIELKHPSGPAVLTGRHLHGLIFPD